MRVGIRDAERLKVSRLPPHPSGLRPWGEGFGAVQIGRNSALCGTFGYIYWELGRSAPVGGRAAQCAAPTAETWQARAARRVVAPYKGGGGNLLPHPPQCAHWGTFPLGGRLRKNKKGQVWNLSLKTWRRSGASQKVLLVPFLSRKGTAYFLFQREQAVGESAV